MTEPTTSALQSLAEGRHPLPFDVLGMHPDPSGSGWVVRAWAPGASEVEIVLDQPAPPPGGPDADSEGARPRRIPAEPYPVADAKAAGPGPLFVARLPPGTRRVPYRLRVDGVEREDPYRFPPVRAAEDLDRLRRPDGRVHDVLGAHAGDHDGVAGTTFCLWAPGARAVSVTGSFNGWSATAHPMRHRGASGVWELFVPGVAAGALYKYRVVGADGAVRLKADPCGRAMQLRPDTASLVPTRSSHAWGDAGWLERGRDPAGAGRRPMSIYEVHLSSWKRKPGARPREGAPGWLSYRELADELVPWVADLGFTHIELLPVTEHPYDGSWGYQTVGYFAPTARHGDADGLRYLVDRAHRAGIGVILDWVPAHFPKDAHGLGHLDGTHLYEHADPRQGVHPDWGTYIFNYGREEVVAFLVSSALYWIEEFHVDGLRLDAVASMLYLDYSREAGAWVPNEHGGRENLEAVAFLQTLNDTIHAEHAGVLVTAEESTAWPRVTHPTSDGGLGFDVKWNMGWMHDTLEVMQADPLFRKGVYEKLTFGATYAYSERFLLPFSHDEVVHLKRSMLDKMPGSLLDRFANLRLLYGYMWTSPGKKLLFMGQELGEWGEWDDQGELDWPLVDEPMHAGLLAWVRALNAAYAAEPALHEQDWSADGFEWLDCHDRDRTTLSYLRWSRDWTECLAVVCNFTPVAWDGYRLAVPFAGTWEVVLDSGALEFGGGGTLEAPAFGTVSEPHLGREQHVELTLPPLAVLVLKRRADEEPRTDAGFQADATPGTAGDAP